ncbi:DUF2624 domain-containing protein [Oceanobacillus halotolerans]|uniref:DUF2624 domain-containing protein n=1 Tax=Oceanobacillus halotolerans TaxID=2663380 RepID=UPI0013DB821A|nr:DUF2624 domain-containing protein [Oceanobacillus halotolerans]
MSQFVKEMINKKAKTLSVKEILEYSKKYDFHINQQEAKAIATYLKQHSIDPFDPNERAQMLKELARITDIQTAKKAQKLFFEIIKSYGLEHLLK